MWRRIDIDVGECVKIGSVVVTLEYKSGRRARLHVSTDNSIEIEHQKKPTPPAALEQAARNMVDNPTNIG